MLAEKSVLIVDDEAGVRQALIRGIKRKFNKTDTQISIIEASNGKEAIDLANGSPPDLILMDIRMPIMDGLKACRILRKDSKFAATMIIMLTCEVTEESAGLLSGADDYVIKPFDIKTLLIRIERGLFKSYPIRDTAFLDEKGILSKDCFLATYLNYEVARAKRYRHPLSLILIKIKPRSLEDFSQECEDEVVNFLQRRTSDKLINWGINVFALLLTETCADDATLLAQRIAWQVENLPSFLKAFIGIANLEDTLVDDLVVNAESSLNAAERIGGVVLNRLEVNKSSYTFEMGS